MGSFTEGVCGCVYASVCESCVVSFRDTKSRSSEVWVCVGRPDQTAAANFPSANVNRQSEGLLRATWHRK